MTRSTPAAHVTIVSPISREGVDFTARPGDGLQLEMLTTVSALEICHSDEPISIGMTWSVPSGAPETIAATDDIPVRADWLQHQFGQGPAMSPEPCQMMVCKDLGTAERWPDFGRMCVAVLGLRSLVTVAVPLPGIRASLTFYSADPAAFDRFDVDAALRLAERAAPLVARIVEATHNVHQESQCADASKVAIALATVMAQHRVGPRDAFAMLRRTGRRCGRPLFHVAVDVVRDGELHDEPVAAPGRPGRDRATPPSDQATGSFVHVGGPGMWRTPPAVPGPAPPMDHRLRPLPARLEAIALVSAGTGAAPRPKGR